MQIVCYAPHDCSMDKLGVARLLAASFEALLSSRRRSPCRIPASQAAAESSGLKEESWQTCRVATGLQWDGRVPLSNVAWRQPFGTRWSLDAEADSSMGAVYRKIWTLSPWMRTHLPVLCLSHLQHRRKYQKWKMMEAFSWNDLKAVPVDFLHDL